MEEIADVVRKTKGILLEAYSHNPFRVKESLEKLEKAVKE